jgi:hypothetical protein
MKTPIIAAKIPQMSPAKTGSCQYSHDLKNVAASSGLK